MWRMALKQPRLRVLTKNHCRRASGQEQQLRNLLWRKRHKQKVSEGPIRDGTTERPWVKDFLKASKQSDVPRPLKIAGLAGLQGKRALADQRRRYSTSREAVLDLLARENALPWSIRGMLKGNFCGWISVWIVGCFFLWWFLGWVFAMSVPKIFTANLCNEVFRACFVRQIVWRVCPRFVENTANSSLLFSVKNCGSFFALFWLWI